MLVSNSAPHHPFTDFSDIFNTDLFNDSSSSSTTAMANYHSSTSREPSPKSPDASFLLTPPTTFPDLTPSSFFNFIDDEAQTKAIDPMLSLMSMTGSTPYDYLSTYGSGLNDIGSTPEPQSIQNKVANRGAFTASESICIDPQLVGTPATSTAISDVDLEDNENESDSEPRGGADADVSVSPEPSTPVPSSAIVKKKAEGENGQDGKVTLLIQPVKVGGKGKARKGTVQNGGIVKRATAPMRSQDKENVIATTPQPFPSVVTNVGIPPFLPQYRLPPSAYVPTNIYPPKPLASESNKDDEDELPQDWRPPPEVFQKMTSKEKRQLRNKISARNFRVRRKEYISTLEGDIAERDRLLDAIRSELGSTQSENFALRQEIAALKRVLLEGTHPNPVGSPASAALANVSVAPSDVLSNLNLPPPAPLPAQSAAETILAQQQAQSQAQQSLANVSPSALLMPNIQKDVSSSSSSHFWGGASASTIGMHLGLGGVTPVHRVEMPEIGVGVLNALAQLGSGVGDLGREKVQENLNPLLNIGNKSHIARRADEKADFDGYADANLFTMKTMDAYRMHLWGRMAAIRSQGISQAGQCQPKQQQQQNQLNGLASSLLPAFFISPAGSLSGKHAPLPPYAVTPPPPYQSYPSSPVLSAMHTAGEREREKERDAVVATAVVAASQTLMKKLGSAFWDAFAGSPSSSSSSTSVPRLWDADKVRKVLEGKAVLRVVDLEESSSGTSSSSPREVGLGAALRRKENVHVKERTEAEQSSSKEKVCSARKCAQELLEESMRSLTLGKKS